MSTFLTGRMGLKSAAGRAGTSGRGRGAGLTTANIALMAGAFQGLPRASVPDASTATRIMQQVGGSFGTAVLAVILVSHSLQVTFWWSVAFTALAVLPAIMLPGLRASQAGPAASGGTPS